MDSKGSDVTNKNTTTTNNHDQVSNIPQPKEVANKEKYDLDKNPIQLRTWDGKLSTEAHDKEYLELVLRSGQHSDLVKKILRQRIDARAKDFPRWPAEMTGGVRAIWIESRFWYDRERMSPDFDDDWRAYRSRYLHSLELHPDEPIRVPEYELELTNPIRRTYLKIGDWFEEKITGKPAPPRWEASVLRVHITRGLMAWALLIGACYWIKFNPCNWYERFRIRHDVSRPLVFPGHKNFPFKDYRTEPAHHADYGFARRTIFKDLRDWEDTTVVL